MNANSVPMQTETQTTTHLSIGVKVGVALLAGAGMSAALIVMSAVSKPILAVHVAPLPVSSTVVPGSVDVPTFGVTLSAKNKDITVTDIAFTALADDDAVFTTVENDVIAQDHIMSCSLIDQVSGALVSGPEPIDGAGRLAFTGTTISVLTTATTTLEVRCDFANIDPQSMDADRYALTIPLDTDVVAEVTSNGNAIPAGRLNVGGPLDPGLNVNGRKVNITVNDAGTLTASLSGATPATDILIGATTNNNVAKLDFIATNEAFSIETLTVTNSGSDDGVAAVKLTYEDSTGAMITDTSFLSSGVAVFTGMDIYVPDDGTRATVTLSVDTNTVGAAGASSGSTMQFSLDLTNPGAFEATGLSSGTMLTETDLGSDVQANSFTLRKTKPTVSLAAGSPSGAGVPGLAEVLRFNVSASSQSDLTWEQVLFKISSTDNSNTGWGDCGDGTNKIFGDHSRWDLYNMDDLSTPISDEGDWSILTTGGTSCAQQTEPVMYAVLNLSADLTTDVEAIGAGSTTTYTLRVDTTGASTANDDSIRFDLVDEATANAISHDALLWSDSEASNIDGTSVKNLPVTGGSLVF